jgi:hypothetical protein
MGDYDFRHSTSLRSGTSAAARTNLDRIDHVVSLELGGSNDIANLFPERANAAPATTSRTRWRTSCATSSATGSASSGRRSGRSPRTGKRSTRPCTGSLPQARDWVTVSRSSRRPPRSAEPRRTLGDGSLEPAHRRLLCLGDPRSAQSWTSCRGANKTSRSDVLNGSHSERAVECCADGRRVSAEGGGKTFFFCGVLPCFLRTQGAQLALP